MKRRFGRRKEEVDRRERDGASWTSALVLVTFYEYIII